MNHDRFQPIQSVLALIDFYIRQEGLFPVCQNSLYKFLNPSVEQLTFFLHQVIGSSMSLESYRQQLNDSGNEMNKRFTDLIGTFALISSGFSTRIGRMVQNYAACGKILMEGFILGKYHYLEAIKEEAGIQGKDHLMEYCRLIDDVSHDLVKLLMQLQLKTEVC